MPHYPNAKFNESCCHRVTVEYLVKGNPNTIRPKAYKDLEKYNAFLIIIKVETGKKIAFFVPSKFKATSTSG